jgi:hypothetical protein
MKVYEVIQEAEASDVELKQRYGDFDPEDKPMLPRTQLKREPAATMWSAEEVVVDILGRKRVTTDDDELEPGMFYLYQSNEPPMFRNTDDGVGSINLPNLDSTSARDVATAAHEAYHAYVLTKAPDGVAYTNEKIINKLTEKWLRKNLSGSALLVALEHVLGSKLSYGQDHLSTARTSDRR